MSRYSFVDGVKVRSIVFSSLVQAGDTQYLNGNARVLAVQREKECFFGNEGDHLSQFRVFNEPIPFLSAPIPTEFSKIDLTPAIRVGVIDVIGASTVGIIHIGNIGDVRLESRIKHIRQLENKEE
ncbi:spore germination protein GerPE [Bacillus spongiae]|uniref:Spore germination protein GerPE n=1 Tax=Bacillus spongiae TaxID=2683610 RepID=A0ABU8HAZ7_9BACI